MRPMPAAPAVLVLALLGLVSASRANTLRVELDGSGDYDDPQVAIWNAAPGDTILIGPGRYDTFRDFSLPGWTEPTIIGIDVDDLTIRGTSKSDVIIGPLEGYWDNFGPMGIVQQVGSSGLVVENLTITNVFDGLYLVTDAVVRDCVFVNGEAGIAAWTFGGLTVTACRFEEEFTGIITFAPATSVHVESSEFADGRFGVSVVGTQDFVMNGCLVRGGTVGVQLSDLSSGTIDSCRFEQQANTAVAVILASELMIRRSRLVDAAESLLVGTHSHVSGSENLLSGSTYATLTIGGYSTFSFTNNDFLPKAGRTVILEAFLEEPTTVDLTGNFWGTTDGAKIQDLIWDGNDDAMIHATVEFEPFLGQPVPTEAQSMGRVKSLFRGAGRQER